MFTKEEISNKLGQRVMDYSRDKDGIKFALDMSRFGYDTDEGWFADFALDNDGTLVWIPDIPTESLVADGKITTLDELENALEDWSSWEC
jgi:hypothetical protein